ncbi:MAG: hypothetical protein QF535_19660, partial [Anaerolineales bacterium]|nr:hypothetical protein [Anaerolineales bacterium]
DGPYNITIYANDSLHNLNNSENISIIKDSVKPAFVNASAESYSGNIGTVFTINITATDVTTHITGANFSLQNPGFDETNNLTINLVSNNATSYNGTWDSTGYSLGTYFFDAFTNDSLNNIAEKDNIFSITLVANGTTDINTLVNSSITTTANTTSTIDDQSNTGIQLDLVTTIAQPAASLTMTSFTDNIANSTANFAARDVDLYFSITVNNATNENLTAATQIRAYYSQAVVDANGIDESTLRLYRFNTSEDEWQEVTPSGVEPTPNYVWGNVTQFSDFAIGGSAPTTSAPTTAGPYTNAGVGGGGGLIREGEEENIGELPSEPLLYSIYKDATIKFTIDSVEHSLTVLD